jgi:predicted permease
MLLVLAAIVVCVSAGVAAEARYGARAVAATARMLDVLLYGVLPVIVFFAIARLHLTAGVGVGIGLAYAELAVVGAIAWWAARRVLHLAPPTAGAVVVATILANTGYLGVPLAATLLGTDAVPTAITWDLGVSMPMLFLPAFAVGAALGTRAGETPRERLRAFVVRNPPLLALVAALLVPDALAPEGLADLARNAALVLLPVGFFVLGVHLRQEADEGAMRFPPPLSPPVVLVLGLRTVAAPLLFAGLALGAHVVAGVRVPHSYFVQAAMPCGINTLVVSHAYGLDLRTSAAAVAWTHALVVGVALVAAAVL